MHDAQLEDRIRNALHAEAEALPFTLTVEDLEARRAARRRGRMDRFAVLSAAAAVVVVAGIGAVLLLERGQVPPVGVSPSPSPIGQASPTIGPVPPLASLAELIAIADGDPIALEGERLGDPSHGDDDLASYVVGTAVDLDQYVDVAWDCSGEGPFTLSWRSPSDGTVVSALEVPGCESSAEVWTSSVPADVDLVVTASPRTSWRVVAYRPEAEPEPSPSRTAPVLSTIEDATLIEERVVEAPSGTVPVILPDGTDDVLIAAACLGTGTFEVSDGTVTRVGACTSDGATTTVWSSVPTASRAMTFDVRNVGAATTALTIYVSDVDLDPDVPFLPPRATLTADGATAVGVIGCGLFFDLGGGNNAVDECGPGSPVIPLDRAIAVSPAGDLRLDLAGWTLSGLTGEVIATDTLIENGGEGGEFASLVDMDGGADSVTFSAPVTAGDWTLRLRVSATNVEGHQFGVPYYVRVIVED